MDLSAQAQHALGGEVTLHSVEAEITSSRVLHREFYECPLDSSRWLKQPRWAQNQIIASKESVKGGGTLSISLAVSGAFRP